MLRTADQKCGRISCCHCLTWCWSSNCWRIEVDYLTSMMARFRCLTNMDQCQWHQLMNAKLENVICSWLEVRCWICLETESSRVHCDGFVFKLHSAGIVKRLTYDDVYYNMVIKTEWEHLEHLPCFWKWLCSCNDMYHSLSRALGSDWHYKTWCRLCLLPSWN